MGDVFITENFLLENDTAIELFHTYARDLPIIDYHCHLPPGEVAEDRRYDNIAQIWLEGDHYKWRALRANGVPERFITGNASDWEKFEKWAETVPKTLRNPLYHWTHLELKKPFGISDRLLGPETAKAVWEECNAKLARPQFSCRGIMKQFDVRLVCTTDDPADTLEHHQRIAADTTFDTQVYPTFRPDKALAVESPPVFIDYIGSLSAASDTDIRHFDSFIEALRKRHDFFHSIGGRLSDHGLETLYAEDYKESEIRDSFDKIRGGAALTDDEIRKFKSAVLYEVGLMYHARDWTQQFHLGALRNNNTRLFCELGPDSGFDSIGDFEHGRSLSKFLDRLDREDKLPKTILYNVNPRDNELFAAMTGNFMDGSVAGKVQFGTAWWYADQLDGMSRQMEALSNIGLLSRFLGMLTDSRSFLSYTRHDYFRRLLCNILGDEIERGLLPRDMGLIGGMVKDIGFENARRYFGFEV